jgi:hypothetical protein
VLVTVGVRTDGTKELVAIAEGYRESQESWAELLRDCRRRGMRAPVLAVGDGALGFWGAAGDVFPETRHQRDWVHKAANILDALPASVQAAAKRALREIWDAEDKNHAERALDAFVRDFAKWPKAVAKLTKDREAMLAFYDFPAEHWIHLRTSNPIHVPTRPGPDRRDQGTGLPGRRPGHVLQADRGGRVEESQRARKTSNMTPAELGYTPVEDPMTKQDFRNLVEKALIAAFGAGPVDTTPDKCIGVAAGNSTLDADVVPCFALHRYDAPRVYHPGHRIFPKSGSHVDNFPQQNYDNGVTKNDQTSKRYKQIVRCVKRLEGELFDEAAIPRDYPGYLIECLVYNVPNDHFGHTKRYDDMRAVLAWLWNNLRDENVYNEWTELSDLKWLFKNRPDRIPKNAFNLVDKAWDKMEFP